MSEKPKMVAIKKIVQETPSMKTFYLEHSMDAKPGQFAMVWIPGLDEKPFTLTVVGKECAVTVQEKGKFTKALFVLKEGEKVGIRGPYGNGFSIEGVKKACIIAGGCGAAPILLLAEQLHAKGIETKVVNGAKTGTECLFRERLSKASSNLYITTDDGSLGEKGFATTVLEKLLGEGKYDMVFGCGPEIMLVKAFEICKKHKVNCQLNLERYMRCGFGVCGACALGKFLVCKDGPVFSSKQLREMPDLGKVALLKSGREVPIKQFADWRQ